MSDNIEKEELIYILEKNCEYLMKYCNRCKSIKNQIYNARYVAAYDSTEGVRCGIENIYNNISNLLKKIKEEDSNNNIE